MYIQVVATEHITLLCICARVNKQKAEVGRVNSVHVNFTQNLGDFSSEANSACQ